MSDTLRAAAQQALEAFDPKNGQPNDLWPFHVKALQSRACKALRAALAAAVAEPVATGFKLVPLEPTPEMAKAGCYRYCAAFVKDYKAMIAAAPAAPPQREPQWQPIETAPRDGSRILIYMPEASRQTVQEAYWATPWEGAPDEQCWWSTPHGPAGRGYTILQKAVTHWMPLPDAPASAPKEQA